ncbi:MAG: SMP-30/gluconolactonase/LRE family protein [Bacteroidota bacterium]
MNQKSNQQNYYNNADSIVADGAVPVLISNQFAFTEGPAADKEGNVYFTDQPNNTIWKYNTGGKLSIFTDQSNRSNGMFFDENGNLLSCADEFNQLILIKPGGEKTVLVNDLDNEKLNGPNDVWKSVDGHIYFTDPLYERPYWKTKPARVKGEYVYVIAKGNSKPQVVINDYVKPNGLIGTPDGKILYVADIGGNKTYRFTIEPDGSLSNKTLFANEGSDGMTIDNLGNIYLTGNGVNVYNKEGKKIRHIAISQPWTANVCFGGSKKNILFITASTAIYSLQMNVQGVN